MTAPTREQQNQRYRNGLCIDCAEHPHSAGRPRCEPCHQTHIHQPASTNAKN